MLSGRRLRYRERFYNLYTKAIDTEIGDELLWIPNPCRPQPPSPKHKYNRKLYQMSYIYLVIDFQTELVYNSRSGTH